VTPAEQYQTINRGLDLASIDEIWGSRVNRPAERKAFLWPIDMKSTFYRTSEDKNSRSSASDKKQATASV